MYKFVVIILLLMTGCSMTTKVAQFTADDAAGATGLANDTGDTSPVPCYQHIGTVAAALAKISPNTSSMSMTVGPIQLGAGVGANKPGLLIIYQASRSIKGIEQDPACAQIFLDLAVTALKLGLPGAAAVIP